MYRTLGLTFMKLLQPKRPLRPRRKGRKRIPVKGLTGQEVKVSTSDRNVPKKKKNNKLSTKIIIFVPTKPLYSRLK